VYFRRKTSTKGDWHNRGTVKTGFGVIMLNQLQKELGLIQIAPETMGCRGKESKEAR
jgi:hypothetical protein